MRARTRPGRAHAPVYAQRCLQAVPMHEVPLTSAANTLLMLFE